jgi:hypothetical protein
VFRLKSHISLYYIAFMRLALSNKIGLFGLICLYLGLFEAIYWTVKSVGRTTRKGINGAQSDIPRVPVKVSDAAKVTIPSQVIDLHRLTNVKVD